MTYTPGQDVEVDYDGIWHRAEVLEDRHGWCMVLMEPDAQASYGRIGAHMDPARSVVCVPVARVRVSA